MRTILSTILLFSALAATGQAPLTRFVANCQFSGFSLLADSTYRGNIVNFDDRLADGINATGITAGFEIIDGRGLVFQIDTVHSSTFVSANVTVTAVVNRGFAPTGGGQVYSPTSKNLIPPSSVERLGLSPVQKAKIDRHNIVLLDSLLARDTVYSITNVPDTTSLSANQGDAFLTTAGDTLGIYRGADGWQIIKVGGGGTTNLTVSQSETTDTIFSDTGTDAVLQRPVQRAAPKSSTAEERARIYLTDDGPKVYDNLTSTEQVVKYDYDVASENDILALKAVSNTLIRVELTGALYRVQADSISGYAVDSLAVIPLLSGNYAVLQASDESGYFVEWFGAIPDDGIADSTAFEKAVYWVTRPAIANKLQIGPGVFDDPLLRIFRNDDGGTYETVGMKVIGAISPYSSSSSLVKPTVFRFNTQHPGLIIQSGRFVHIENIYFEGETSAPFYNKDSLINVSDWSAYHASNERGPHAGIVIDPFYVANPNKYTGLSSFYTGYGSGSSMVTIENCGFFKLDHAIAETGNNLNGDNINIVNSSAEAVRVFYASYSSQSRANSIDNVYVRFCQTFFRNGGLGAPPSIRNVSGAGFIKEIFSLSTQRSKATMDNSQWEALWRIGTANASPLTITQTQFKFEADTDINTPPTIFIANSANFYGCSFLYFTNCAVSPAMPIEANNVTFDGCFFEVGGVPFITDLSGQRGSAVNFNNCELFCSGEPISRNSPQRGSSVPNSSFLAGNTTDIHRTSTTNGGQQSTITYLSNVNYGSGNLGSIQVDSITATTAKFVVSGASQRIRVGEPIISLDLISSEQTSIGYVTSISADTVFLGKTVAGLDYATSNTLYVQYPLAKVALIWGDITSGNDTITNLGGSSTFLNSLNVGWRIGSLSSGLFPQGAYIEEINIGSGFIVMSAPATGSETEALLGSTPYKQEIIARSSGLLNTWEVVKGAVVINNTGHSAWTRSVCTNSGIIGTSNAPVIVQDAIVQNGTSGQIPVWNASNNRYEPGTDQDNQNAAEVSVSGLDSTTVQGQLENHENRLVNADTAFHKNSGIFTTLVVAPVAETVTDGEFIRIDPSAGSGGSYTFNVTAMPDGAMFYVKVDSSALDPVVLDCDCTGFIRHDRSHDVADAVSTLGYSDAYEHFLWLKYDKGNNVLYYSDIPSNEDEVDARLDSLESPSRGGLYISHTNPDTITVATGGTFEDFTDVTQDIKINNFTVNTTTGQCTYNGTETVAFDVMWTITFTCNANNENIIGRITDNAGTLERIRWEEEDTASGDRHSAAASGTVNMSTNDWLKPQITSETNGTEVRIHSMHIIIKEAE